MPTENIKYQLYGGEIVINFLPSKHWYKLDGEKHCLISATGAVGIVDKSAPLMKWAVRETVSFLKQHLETSNTFSREELLPVIDEAARQHEIKKEKAATAGEKVHKWIEQFADLKIEGKDIDESSLEGLEPAVLNGVNMFLDWYNQNHVQFISSERLVYSKKHKYVGTTDALAVVNGKRTILDYKTSNGLYSTHYYQLSGYWNAVDEEDGKPFIEEGLILHLPTKVNQENLTEEIVEFHSVPVSPQDHKKNFKTFLACLAVKEREKELARY